MVDTLQILLSTDGKHTVIVPVSDDWKKDLETACAIYDEVAERYGLKHEQHANGKKEPACPVHKTPMTYVEGKYGPFWSCRQKTNGGYCRKTVEA